MFTANGLLFGATRELPVASWRPMCSIWRQLPGLEQTQHYGSWKTGENAIPGYAPWRSCTVAAIRSLLSLYALERPHAGTIDEPVNRPGVPTAWPGAPIGLFPQPTGNATL